MVRRSLVLSASSSFALAAGALVVASCTVEEVAQPEVGPTWYRDVQPIIQGRCAGCHRAGDIGPYALTTYEEVSALRELVLEAISARTMPPWSADRGVAYKFDPSLSDEQIERIRRWVEAGAPEGDPADAGAPLPEIAVGLTRVDMTLGMVEAYVPEVAPDEYRCFVIDWPMTETVYVTGFAAKPGNTTIDHHVAAYLVTPDNPLGDGAFDGLAQLDAADPRPGYECFGGPAGESDLQIPAMQIGQWVPGQGGGDFPAGTGIKVPAGSKIVMQMHYNLPPGNTASDRTQVQLKFDAAVEKEAAFAPWLDVAWVAGNMKIPAFEPDVVHKKTGDPRPFFSAFVGDTDVSQGFRIHSAMLHLHKLGTRAHVEVHRADGSKQTILSISSYDFDWQRLYELETPIDFHPGDQLSVECHFANTPEQRQGEMPVEVNWGEGSTDEMCVANLYVSEP